MYVYRAIKVNVFDYIIKPFTRKSIELLLDKVFKGHTVVKKMDLTDNCIFDFHTHSLYRDDQLVKLTKMQTLLLELLLERHNQVVGSEEIYYCINGNMHRDINVSVRNVIRHLRAVLPPNTIETIYGVGYRLIL